MLHLKHVYDADFLRPRVMSTTAPQRGGPVDVRLYDDYARVRCTAYGALCAKSAVRRHQLPIVAASITRASIAACSTSMAFLRA